MRAIDAAEEAKADDGEHNKPHDQPSGDAKDNAFDKAALSGHMPPDAREDKANEQGTIEPRQEPKNKWVQFTSCKSAERCLQRVIGLKIVPLSPAKIAATYRGTRILRASSKSQRVTSSLRAKGRGLTRY